ncbi:hypothetical protein [Methylobacterium sp. Leaf88]|uniref:hypothetical protein n=1 Tax=Methylobacterium sp. Leaf88 TaxID=1736244 RepID=UPI0006FFD1FB|nr:hypothetical protein [Methylobacterium sp. Leaf88]KQO61770.1 hypothetical protein ASF20_09885 [Methylobacterium sp. Leaf88]
MFHFPNLAHVRLDRFAPMVRPDAELVAMRDEFQARVNAGPRAAHARAIHPDLPGVKGKVSLMRVTQGSDGEHRWETKVVSVSELATSDALLWATHISMQRFYGARGSTSLVQLQDLIADVDCHDKAEFRGRSPEEMAGILIQRLRDAGKPMPSYIAFSGRGLHCVWLHQPLQATPGVTGRHRAVQRWMHGPAEGKASKTVRTKGGTRLQDPEVISHEETMAAVWRGTGLDRGAVDTARVLRLAGSYNGKSGKVARLVWPASWADVERHDFEDLASAFLPFTRDQMDALKAERQAEYEIREARRQARRSEAEAAGIPVVEDLAPARRISGGYWPSVVQALDALRIMWGGTPDIGKRDLWAFLSACALAQSEGGTAASWAERLAGPAGLPEAELRTSLGALERVLRRQKTGETRDHDGVERPVMYVYSKARMLSLLGLNDVSEETLRGAGAGALLPGGVVRSERQRSADRRAEAGATPLVVTVSARLADGREALAMKAAGKAMREIVAAFAGRRGETSLRRAMAEAGAEVPTETVTEAAVEIACETSKDGSVSSPHGSTTSIVAVPGALPPSGETPAVDTPGDAIPARPAAISVLSPTLDPQGSPRMASGAAMNTGSGPRTGGAVATFPGLRSAPFASSLRPPLPAFIARLLAAGTCSADAVSA